jgi:hypothetical protein
MRNITVVTEISDCDGSERLEYAGILVSPTHAFYVDPAYNVVVLERVRPEGDTYVTTGGYDATGFELNVPDTSFINRIGEMSAIDLLQALSKTNL